MDSLQLKKKAPFPYFGGKRKIAHLVWSALGNVKCYIEPFCGSLSVLLARPYHDPVHHIEIANDKDGFICNFWRALQKEPDKVAYYCDTSLVHQIDLTARKRYLKKHEQSLVEKLMEDPEYYDAKLAGYWVYVVCTDIACWAKGNLHNNRPHFTDHGKGIHQAGIRKIKARNLSLFDFDNYQPYNEGLFIWFRALAERLRYVKFFCGDWKSVCKGYWQDRRGIVGFFLDPPYSVKRSRLYNQDDFKLKQEVLQWCIERGQRPSYRIVLAGYEEYEELVEKHGWTKINWTTNGGFGNYKKKDKYLNKFRETLYFSPYCNKIQLF